MTDPRDFAVGETLRNGAALTIRALRPDDRERLRAAYAQLSPTTLYLRTFGHRKDLSEAELSRYVAVDFTDTVALVALAGETIVAGGRYVRLREASDAAEVAFTVEEDFQGLGIASRLLRHLAAIAREHGVRRFVAEVLPENAPMLAVFERSGLPAQRRREGGVVHVELALGPTSR